MPISIACWSELVNDVEHTKLYAGYGCLVLVIYLDK